MTYRATRPPQQGGWDLLKEWASREFTRIQQALQKSPVTEQGVFTPTFDFATTGDLSNSYATQIGRYWVIGPLLHYHYHLTVTPTHTTASGAANFGGLPYAPTTEVDTAYMGVARLSGTGLTWPSSSTQVVAFARDGEAFFNLANLASGSAGASLASTGVGSGVALSLYASGFYPIK